MRKILFLILGCAITIISDAQNACGIINSYYKVNFVDTCNNIVYVTNKGLQKGDRVVIMQMNGVNAQLNNNNTFGNLTAINHAGNYEFNVVSDVIADTQLNFSLKFLNKYDPSKALQIIQFPAYRNVNITCPLTCAPWNGNTGGVLVLYATDTIRIQSQINLNGKGFRGRYPMNAGNCLLLPYTNYYTTAASNLAGRKGEGVFELAANYECGRGKAVNAGGGGNEHNSGGGGGANFGGGGDGGERIKNILSCPGNYPGIGGEGLAAFYSNTLKNRLFMGGSGGVGHENNNFSDTSGSGGGIAFVISKIIKSNNDTIMANGESVTSACIEDGGSGGGGGGVIVIKADTIYGKILLSVKGGFGQSVDNSAKNECYGPGGGGGGGVIAMSMKTNISNTVFDTTGGKAGIVYNSTGSCNNTTNGALNGFTGKTLLNFVYNESPIIFRRFTVTAGSDMTICKGDSVQLNVNQGSSFEWFPNYNLNNNKIKSPKAAPDTTTFYVIKASDSCSFAYDTVKVTVLQPPNITRTNDTSFCYGDTIQLQVTGGGTYEWSPPVSINNISIGNPKVWPSTSTKYAVKVSNGNCYIIDTIRISVFQAPVLKLTKDTLLCLGDKVKLHVSGASSYEWSPDSNINDIHSADPEITATRNITYKVKGSNGAGCYAFASINITVDSCKIPPPVPKQVTVFLIPNVFTPNNDGFNDEFSIGAKNIFDFNITIYNRWGQQLFFSTDPSFKWDGAQEPAGVYYLKYSYKDLDQVIHEGKSSVTLIR